MKKFVHKDIVEFLDERFYKIGGKYYPSVTTILDCYPKGKYFTQWLKDVGNSAKQIMERAADTGSRVHDAISRILKGEKVTWNDKLEATAYHGTSYTKEEWEMLLRFKEFHDLYKPTTILIEQQIFSEKYGYAGTLDWVCEFGGLKYLIDFKSGNSIWETHYIQLSAYKVALLEESGIVVDRAGLLHLNADTRKLDKEKFQGDGWKLDFGKGKDYFKLFLSTLDLYKNEEPDAKPKNLVYPIEIKI